MGKSLNAEVGSVWVWEIDFSALAQEGEPLRAVADLVRETAAAVRTIVQQPMGKDALKEIQKMVFKEGAGGVARDKTTLIITAAMAQGTKGRLAPPALRAAIETTLQ